MQIAIAKLLKNLQPHPLEKYKSPGFWEKDEYVELTCFSRNRRL